jgi:hypothetical protein
MRDSTKKPDTSTPKKPLVITPIDVDYISNMCGSTEICLYEETIETILNAAIHLGLVKPQGE